MLRGRFTVLIGLEGCGEPGLCMRVWQRGNGGRAGNFLFSEALKGQLLLREIREGSRTVFVIASVLLEIPASEGAELDGRQRWLLLLRDCSDYPR